MSKLTNTQETPEQKAERLGVVVIKPFPHKHDVNKEKPKPNKMTWLPPIVAVCGGCSKEIKLGARREPCGKTICPFGILV